MMIPRLTVLRLPWTVLFLLISQQHHDRADAFSPMTTTTSGRRSTSTRLHVLGNSMEVSAALTALDSFYQTQPYQAAFLTCSFKASAADWVVQTKQQQQQQQDHDVTTTTTSMSDDKEDIAMDLRRNLAFLVYGGFYQGVFQQFLYNTLFPLWFGSDRTVASVLEQVAVDMAVMTPFLCLPMAYLVKETITGVQQADADDNTNNSSLSSSSSLVVMSGRAALETYWVHVQQEGLLKKYWTLWIPVQTLTFGVIPQHLRIVFIAAVSFVWLMILSSISSSSRAIVVVVLLMICNARPVLADASSAACFTSSCRLLLPTKNAKQHDDSLKTAD